MGRTRDGSAATVLSASRSPARDRPRTTSVRRVPVPERFYADRAAAEARSLADVPWWNVFDDPILKGLIESDPGTASTPGSPHGPRAGTGPGSASPARSSSPPSITRADGNGAARPVSVNPRETRTGGRRTPGSRGGWICGVRIRRLNEGAIAAYLPTEEGRPGSSCRSFGRSHWYIDCASWTGARDREEHDRCLPGHLRPGSTAGSRRSGLSAGNVRAEASLAQVAAQIPSSGGAIVPRRTQINFLLGRNPQTDFAEGPLLRAPPGGPAGLPSTLLERRPRHPAGGRC